MTGQGGTVSAVTGAGPSPSPLRIVITGVGLVCAAGADLASAAARLAQGPLTPEPPDDAAVERPWLLPLPASFKAEAFAEKRKDLKLMARANLLAVAACKAALAQSGAATGARADAGLYLGVGREPGKLEDLLPTLSHARVGDHIDLDALVTRGMDWMHPLSSLKTLPNMSVAHVAIALGIQGPNQALCTEAEAGAVAILEAAKAIQEGRCPWALAGGADARTAFSDRLAAARMGAGDVPLGEAAAVFVLEPWAAAQARGAAILGEVVPRTDEAAVPADALGDCGAATFAAALALALTGDAPVSVGAGPVAVHRGQPAATASKMGAPAIHLRRGVEPVAITALGLQTPLGDRWPDFIGALLSGHSASGAIGAFDARNFPVTNACEVADQHLIERLPEPLMAELRGRGDRRAELALLAGLAAAEAWGRLPAEAGCVFATGLSSVKLEQLDQDLTRFITAEGTFDDVAFGRAPTAARPMAPWRNLVARPLDLLADHLGLRGPRACHFSACAAGAAAVAHAADLVRRGVAPAMLVGGADSMVHPFGMLPFIRLGATTLQSDPERAGLPFDRDRDGFVMGEGAAFFVVEPVAAAKAAGRPILGLLLGAGTSLDAWRVTAPHPDGLGAERSMRAALADAGLDPAQVDYVNAHGTGTPLNDVTESAAIARVFAGRKGPAVSSSKAQFGHAIAAAGALELAAVLAGFAGDRMPPTAHLQQLDPAIEVDVVGPEGRAGGPRIALSNSFGFGGQNATLAIGHPDLAAEVRP